MDIRRHIIQPNNILYTKFSLILMKSDYKVVENDLHIIKSISIKKSTIPK
jgi:hypothetical protein